MLTKASSSFDEIDFSGSKGRVLDLLRIGRAGTRAELAALTGLSRGAISFIVTDLEAAGFLQTSRGKANGRGRPGERLHFNAQARLVLGIEVGDDQSTAILADLHAQPLHSVSVPVRGGQPADALAAAIQAAQEVAAHAGDRSLLGAGVAVPGLVTRDGAIQMAPDLGWHNVPVADTLEEVLGLPVLVANRAKTAAVGESWRGAAIGLQRALYVSISTGISLGIVLDGSLYRGASLAEGELGHTTVEPDGPLCPCGNHGCLQTLASGPALLALARQRARQHADSVLWHTTNGHLEQLTLPQLAEALHSRDMPALEALERVGRYLGIAIANLINLINPEIVVLGGSVSRELPDLVEPVREEVRRRALGVAVSVCAVVPSALGGDAPLVGAAAYLLQGLFTGAIKPTEPVS
ncbi:MAG: ROK family transcriptional regulator [Chloroflexi bacterium]|nr:ROK family transcriptional regulator [Chloroflexota bacterium]